MQSTLDRGLKILFRSVILALIVLSFIELTYRVITAFYAKNAFTAALLDKHDYAKSISSPKIVLVGGSNLAFGINSEMLSKMTGMPVVNMALLAPLGMDFILSDALGYIKKGDIVMMSFEYDVFPKGDVESQLSVVDFVPEDKHFVTYKQGLTEKLKAQFLHRLQAPLSIEIILQSPTVEDPYSIYFRKAFTRQGDIISHLNNITRTVNAGANTTSLFPYEGQAESMNAFTEQFVQKGAKAYFLYPTIAESFYKNSVAAVEKLDERYRKDLKATILSAPEQSVYPDSLCFDTVYHLKGKARDAHTEKVAGALLRLGK
ncbi:hypothetical protein [Dyadobacter sp. CY347]|uniref:hypothetical protein n=1 Tax=Dyadobacter sp. CY347 TaxID=2909336 RepID=UPI001F303F5A|nr:hypothetical protein [Dyadobacter sp. CY347]MCF2489332.1 hypothetical protein [Dyadobacter sp. CY347]